MKYKLNFGECAFVEYTKQEYSNLKEVKVQVTNKTLTKGKEVYIKTPNWKYAVKMIVPIENFEVCAEK